MTTQPPSELTTMQTLQDKMAKLSPKRRQKIETLTAELVNEEHRHDIERTEQASNED